MKKGYSIVVSTTDSSRSRYLFISKRLLAVMLSLAIALLVIVIIAIISYSRVYYQALQTEMLKYRNAQIEKEFAKMEKIVENLRLAEMDNQKIKVMLGIEKTPSPIDPNATADKDYSNNVNIFLGAENNIPSLLPTKGQISRDFGPGHEGIDIAAPQFSPVIATASGFVTTTGWDSLYGNYIIIEHNRDYSTFYGHLNSIEVKTNDKVSGGTVIGTIGSSGRSTSPHLHYEIRFRGKPVEPMGYVPYFVIL